MIKPPWLTPIATIGIPTIAMVLLLLLPFYDRNPERRPERRPIATTAGILTIIAMAYLTFLGATAGTPTEIDLEVAADLEPGKEVAAQSGCLRLPQDRRERERRPGARADRDRREAAPERDRALARGRPGDHALLLQSAAAEEATT